MDNSVDFLVTGQYALFTDPITKLGGEKYSYQIPTYEAIKGIVSSIYWKPTIVWIVDKIRVMNRIRTQTRSVKPLLYDAPGNSLGIYNYLYDVAYQVRTHFVWNENRPDLTQDRIENKHFQIAKRMIARGGRRDIFLGTRECQGYVEPCKFGEGEGFYDGYGELSFDLMFHGFNYPDETNNEIFQARFWRPKMLDGVIHFPKPTNKDLLVKDIRRMKPTHIPTSGWEEADLWMGLEEV
ncbi:MAG: type I-C CRISPR-associated protein Cas5c [Anaerolineaceae bacterium]